MTNLAACADKVAHQDGLALPALRGLFRQTTRSQGLAVASSPGRCSIIMGGIS
jgi:methyl coenzyme M reductase subunit C